MGDRKERARVELVGLDRSKGQYKRTIEKLGLEKLVVIREPIPIKDVAMWLDGADVLVLPSRFDGWGMTVSEAASMGKAIIATSSVGAAGHLVVEGVNGKIVRPNSVSHLGEAMAFFLDNYSEIQKYGIRSKAVFQDYSAQACARKLIRILDETRPTGDLLA